MNRPCAIGWCVALAHDQGDLCKIHESDLSFRPSRYKPEWRERKNKWPPIPWEDEISLKEPRP